MRLNLWVFLLAKLVTVPAIQGADLVAFDLTEAERQIRSGAGTAAEITTLGGISSLTGLVMDEDSGRVILVGRRDKSAPGLGLDELATAIRAVVGKREWPLVSIDPRPDTPVTLKQVVRLEGGIEDTRFGAHFLAADVILKFLALGRVEANGLRLTSYFDLRAQSASTAGRLSQGRSRLWFHALNPVLEERDGVFLVRSLELGVKAQTVQDRQFPTGDSDDAGAEFAQLLTSTFGDLCELFPEIARLRRLYEMVAIAKGMDSLPQPMVAFWVHDYPILKIPTPREFDLVSREETIQTGAGLRALEVSGGIQFRALMIRLQEGDISALKEAVIQSRPAANSLSWILPISTWCLSIEDDYGDNPASGQPDSDAGSSLGWRVEGPDPAAGRNAKPTYQPVAVTPGRMVSLSESSEPIGASAGTVGIAPKSGAIAEAEALIRVEQATIEKRITIDTSTETIQRLIASGLEHRPGGDPTELNGGSPEPSYGPVHPVTSDANSAMAATHGGAEGQKLPAKPSRTDSPKVGGTIMRIPIDRTAFGKGSGKR